MSGLRPAAVLVGLLALSLTVGGCVLSAAYGHVLPAVLLGVLSAWLPYGSSEFVQDRVANRERERRRALRVLAGEREL